jgi:hypothetical protein
MIIVTFLKMNNVFNKINNETILDPAVTTFHIVNPILPCCDRMMLMPLMLLLMLMIPLTPKLM